MTYTPSPHDQLAAFFPMLSCRKKMTDFVYLDSAATSLKPQVVIDEMSDFYAKEYATVHRAIYRTSAKATARYNEVRGDVAAFFGAEPCEIVFTRGATSAINLVARSCGKLLFGPGDEVVITELEHHSNIVPWQMMAEERGVKCSVVPVQDDGTLDLQVLEKLLVKKPKLVSFCHISNTVGQENPLREIIDLCHNAGAYVLVDAAQSAAHHQINVKQLDIDFLVASSHKMYGPTGLGVLVAKKELLERMEPQEGGGDMIEEVRFEKTTYAPIPLKFEAGTPMIAEVIGFGRALKFLQEIGLETVASVEKTLMSHLLDELKTIPDLHFLGDSRSKESLVSFWIDGVHPLDVATLMDAKGIAMRSGHLCAQPIMRRFGIQGALRFSLALYNTHDEIAYAIESLKKIIKTIK